MITTMKKVYILRDMENRKSLLSRGTFDKCAPVFILITFRKISLRSRSNVWRLYYSDVFDVCIVSNFYIAI